MKILKALLNVSWIWLVLSAVFYAGWMSHYFSIEHKLNKQTSIYCQDKPNRTAWLAKRDGKYKCFLEDNNYPHRAKGYINIHEQPENYYPTPHEFVQRELRPNLSEDFPTTK